MLSTIAVASKTATFLELKAALGAPTCGDDNYAIYCGDCVELLSKLPAESIPLTVTSPPYNIGKEYEEIAETDAYLDWSARWIEGVFNATNASGAFWLNLGYVSLPGKAKAIPLPYLLWDKIPFYLLQEIVWNYGAGVAAKKTFSPRNEKFLWYVKNATKYTFDLDAVRDPNVKYPNQKKNGKLKCNPLGKNPTDVWQMKKVTSGTSRSSRERTPHPAQFPVELVSRIVRACSSPNEVIVDPFVGSGSLIEAALREGRKAIGFEINPDYVKIAKRRIEKVSAQLASEKITLF